MRSRLRVLLGARGGVTNRSFQGFRLVIFIMFFNYFMGVPLHSRYLPTRGRFGESPKVNGIQTEIVDQLTPICCPSIACTRFIAEFYFLGIFDAELLADPLWVPVCSMSYMLFFSGCDPAHGPLGLVKRWRLRDAKAYVAALLFPTALIE